MDRDVALQRVRHYVIENFYFGKSAAVTDDTDLMEDGAVDSTGFMELVSFVEDSFPISIDDEDLAPENFGNINRIVEFVLRACAA